MENSDTPKLKAHEILFGLWDVVKEEGNNTDYVKEMICQLELIGIESNTLTKESLKNKLINLLDKLNENNSL